MKSEEVKDLPHGLYIVQWKKKNGGGFSLASVGSDSAGKRWFAPTNWINGHAYLEDHCHQINEMHLIVDSRRLNRRNVDFCFYVKISSKTKENSD